LKTKGYKDSLAWKVVLKVCALLLGGVFIFSGFVKAIDPLGTCYKITDYIEAFDLTSLVPSFLPLMLSVALCMLEFTVGVMLLLRVRRKLSSFLALVMLIVMTPLTFYLALTNPISDCGCFGDALVLTNWQTFGKNVVLLMAAVVVNLDREGLYKFFAPTKDWMVSLWAVIFIMGVAMYCLYYLPLIDFRPYKVGVNIPEAMAIPEGAKRSVFDTRFVYEKDRKQQKFGLDNLPDSTWTFVEQEIVLLQKGYEPPINDFTLLNTEMSEEVTEELLANEGYTFLLVVHRVEEANDSDTDLVNEVYDYSVEHGYAFYALTSSPEDEIEEWRERTGAEYPFLIGDDVMLKTVVRSNPGLLLLKQGTILNKWPHTEIPDEFMLTDALDKIEIGQQAEIDKTKRLGMLAGIFLLPLLLIALQDWTFRKRKDEAEKD